MVISMFGGLAYIALAVEVNDLAVATEDSVLGRQRGVIMAVLLTGAALQLAIQISDFFGVAALVEAFRVVADSCLLAVPVSFWPVVERLKRGQLHVLNRRLTDRATRAERHAADSYKWLCLAEQTAHVGHWSLTTPGSVLLWSDEMYRIHGLWREHYQPRIETALAAFHPLDGKRVAAALQQAAARRERFEVAARLRRPDGEIRHIIMHGDVQLDEAGQGQALAGVMVDVTEPRRAEARLVPYAALREIPMEDSLTGLADRHQFDLTLSYEFKRAVRSRKPFGLVLLEIDHFPTYREHYGVMEGYACLRRVAQAVQAMPRRTGDVVARYSDGEIAVLLPLADAAGAFRVASQIADVIRALAMPHAALEAGCVSVSCGAAAFSGIDDLYNPLELTRRAAAALADAAATGGNRVCAYTVEAFVDSPVPR